MPKTEIAPEVAATITRLTRGNFRLLAGLLTQMQRAIEINQLSEFSIDIVENARENLVIGQAYVYAVAPILRCAQIIRPEVGQIIRQATVIAF